MEVTPIPDLKLLGHYFFLPYNFVSFYEYIRNALSECIIELFGNAE